MRVFIKKLIYLWYSWFFFKKSNLLLASPIDIFYLLRKKYLPALLKMKILLDSFYHNSLLIWHCSSEINSNWHKDLRAAHPAHCLFILPFKLFSISITVLLGKDRLETHLDGKVKNQVLPENRKYCFLFCQSTLSKITVSLGLGKNTLCAQ